MKNRIISMILAVSLCLSLAISVLPSASAAYDYEPQGSLYSILEKAVVNFWGEKLGLSFDAEDFQKFSRSCFSETGLVASLDVLYDICEDYNNSYRSVPKLAASGLEANSIFFSFGAEVAYDYDYGIYRIRDSYSGCWVVDYYGRFPYFEVVATEERDNTITPSTVNPIPEFQKINGLTPTNQWIPDSEAIKNSVSVDFKYSYTDMVGHVALMNYYETKNASGAHYSVAAFGKVGLYGIRREVPTSHGYDDIAWLANSNKELFLTTKSANELASNQVTNNVIQDKDGNTVTSNGDTVTNETTIIDGDMFNAPITNITNYDNSTSIDEYIENLVKQYITNYTYNIDDHSYTVNTFDTTYNIDNRAYVTNNYTWNIKYNITNTYVTYIGSNDNYQKEYEFYYELPDGRSSADLTADEVAALSLQFSDTINYTRAATDTNLRALYHFDGDTDDSGYFSTKTEFTWTTGASITYMDSGVFNGALYLDDSPHDFSIKLPSAVKAGEDFTVQWRYYQASEADTQDNVENYVSLGGTVLAKWDERYLYNPSGTKLCYLPIGSWMELAVMRHNGTMYIYCNGVKVGSVSNNDAFSSYMLRYYLGATSRAYSMFDDLRVLDFALVTDGLNYTPTAVPHDSNLVLTLPGEEAVVESWWEYKSPNNLIEKPRFDSDGDYSTISTQGLYSCGTFGVSTAYSGYAPDWQLSTDGVVLTGTSSTGYYGNSWIFAGACFSVISMGAIMSGVSWYKQYTFSIIDRFATAGLS